MELVDDICEIPAKRIILLNTQRIKKEPSRQLVLKRYTRRPQLRDLIKGFMHTQKRKMSTWSVWESYAHSNFFLNRTESCLIVWFTFGILLKKFF